MADTPTNFRSFDQQDHLQVIDALRGYAILIVIAVHTLGHVPDLAWPVKRVLTMGFYGVQLFFLASAVTLMMSWHRSADPFGARSLKFLVRRFFRIAPLYWMAVVFYWFAYEIRAEDFSLQLLFATLFFYNAWSPYLIPTVPGWTPVPGGWSIGVEFCFYLTFPLIATLVTSLRRALGFVALALGVMLAASHFGQGLYPEIGMEERANFLYFWPPNQLVVFALGFLLYHLVKDEATRRRIIGSKISADLASLAMLGATLAVALSLGPNKFFDWNRGLPPTHLVMSLCFVPWALVLILKPSGRVINRAITGLGKVSFSAYVLHFAVLRYTGHFLHQVWPVAKTGIYSIAFEAVFLVVALVLTRAIGEASYRLIEQPFIDLGKALLGSLRQPPAAAAAKTGR
ncbi:MAG: acyltransferase [Zoogloea sp.]|uniref:acyltransferase family protein n=1 Tax=Zoogloea sp. TaxID=49181 RepID=UPI00261192D7|nr:acyltransferase [Zoogloea sp.]MDD3327081.1 acyltransferase [Zoogloea sp.]